MSKCSFVVSVKSSPTTPWEDAHEVPRLRLEADSHREAALMYWDPRPGHIRPHNAIVRVSREVADARDGNIVVRKPHCYRVSISAAHAIGMRPMELRRVRKMWKRHNYAGGWIVGWAREPGNELSDVWIMEGGDSGAVANQYARRILLPLNAWVTAYPQFVGLLSSDIISDTWVAASEDANIYRVRYDLERIRRTK